MNTFNPIEFINQLCALGERQFEAEKKAALIIKNICTENKIDFQIQQYNTFIPKFITTSCVIDGESIDCLPTGLKSGEINSKNAIISSLISSQKNFYDTNINFSPASEAISRSNHYQATSVAIAKSNLEIIVNAKEVHIKTEVQKTKHQSENILVGNIINPKTIIFSHYDSIETGAIDNASGVAASIKAIIENPKLIQDNLFVIAGNEEISYDETIYWGHGYRVFEEGFENQIKQAQQLICVDCIGYSDTVIFEDVQTVTLGLPLKKINEYISKTIMISGDFEGLLKVYHTKDDTPEKIIPEFFEKNYQSFLEKLK